MSASVVSETAPPSYYDKLLSGSSDSSATMSYSAPFDRAEKPVDEPKPVTSMWAPTSSYQSPFDDAQKLIDAAPAVHLEAKPEAPMSSVAPADDWMSAFGEPSASAVPVSTALHFDAPSKQPDSGVSWTSALDEPASPVDKYLDSPASPVVATPTKTKAEDGDSIAKMGRLFKEYSLVQKSENRHMVSIKLYRSK